MDSNLTNKIQRAFNEQCVGNMVFSNAELDELYSYVNQVLRQFVNERGASLNSLFDEYMFVAMVNACKEWNSEEDTFFGHIYRKLLGSDDGNQKVYNYITEMLSRLSRGENGILYLDCYKKKYYATTIAHALAPKQSTDSFFELCWQIYCNDMDQSFSRGDSIFSLLAAQLQAKFLGNEDDKKDVQFGSMVYSFRAGIKGIAIKYPERMELLLRDAIELVHKLFNGESIEHDKHLNLLAEKWWKGKEETLGIQKVRKTSNKDKVVSDYSSITCKYVLEDQVVLNVPAFRLLSNMDERPQLEIYCGSDLVYSSPIDTKGSGIIMSAKSTSIKLDDIVPHSGNFELRVQLKHAGEIIFDSEKILFRSYILFKNDREIFAKDCQPGNYSLYTYSMEQFGQYPKSINYLGSHIFTLCADDGEVLQTEKQTIFFSSEKRRHDIWLQVDKCADVSFVFGQDEYSVVNGEIFVQVQKEINPRDYGVRYDNVVFNLTDFDCEDKVDFASYPITSIINVGEPQSICIFKYSDGRILASMNVIKFNNIQISYDKPFFYDNDATGTVEFKTDKYHETTDFSIDDDDVTIRLNGGLLHFKPPVLRWRIDDGDWSSQFVEKPIWYEAITNSSIIEFSLPTNIVGKLYLTNGQTVESCGKSINEFRIGQTIHALVGSCREITAIFRLNEDIGASCQDSLIPIATFCLKEKMSASPLILSKQRLFWNAENVFIGNENSNFEVSISNTHGHAVTYEFDRVAKFANIPPMEDDYYRITVALIKKGFITSKEQIWDETVCIGDERELRFKNKYISVSNVMLAGISEETTIRPFHVGALHFIGEQDGSMFYSGSVFIVDRYERKIYLNTMKNDYGEYEHINPVRLEMRTDKSFWMVWGLNKEDLNDFQAEFTLSDDNKICNSDKNVRAIDFYLIDKVGEE